MKPTSCDLCGKNDHKALPRFVTSNLRIVVCNRCGLISTNPQWSPEEIARLYDEEFSYDVGADINGSKPKVAFDKSFESSRMRARKYSLPIVCKHVDPAGKRWIDLRCRTGGFLFELAGLGADVYGVDLFEPNIKMAQSKFDSGRFHVSSIHDWLKPVQGQFDVVSAMSVHVLAHTPSPSRLLKDICERLNPGGLVFIEEKDVTRIPRGVATFPVRNVKGLVHYHHLTLNTTRSLVERAGFEIVESVFNGRSSALEHFVVVGRKRVEPAPPPIYPESSTCDNPKKIRRKLIWLYIQKAPLRAWKRGRRILGSLRKRGWFDQ